MIGDFLKDEYKKGLASNQFNVNMHASHNKTINDLTNKYRLKYDALWLKHQEELKEVYEQQLYYILLRTAQMGEVKCAFFLPALLKRQINGVVVSPVTERLMKYCEDNNINASLIGNIGSNSAFQGNTMMVMFE